MMHPQPRDDSAQRASEILSQCLLAKAADLARERGRRALAAPDAFHKPVPCEMRHSGASRLYALNYK
jgi:hypothetical protein